MRIDEGRAYTRRVSRQESANKQRPRSARTAAQSDAASSRADSFISAIPSWLDTCYLLTILIAFALCTLPFVAKPFHIDDPMYIWAAEQILKNPADFYGFDVVWAVASQPMSTIMQNPPLASYLIALVIWVAGLNEVTLHLVFLLPALGLVLGTHQLAKSFCRAPVLAALITMATPVFIVSSLTITCDMLMACFWVWAVALWHAGMKANDWKRLTVAAILCGLSALSKYYGTCLIPLLGAYTLVHPGRRRAWAALLLIPALMLLAYEAYTAHLYGTGLLAGAAQHARDARAITHARIDTKTLVSLAFIGACLLPALLLAPLLWSWRGLAVLAVLTPVLAFVAHAVLHHGIKSSDITHEYSWILFAQIGLWATVGVSLAAVCVRDLWRHRDADSLLLALWIGGSFLFAAYVNWSINGRSILPMAPAVAIVLARELEFRHVFAVAMRRRWLVVALLLSAAISMLVEAADYSHALSARRAAQHLGRTYAGQSDPLFFQGHWGFHYYMERNGGTMLNPGHSRIPPGSIMVVPRNNVNVQLFVPRHAMHLETHIQPTWPWMSTMNLATGAGFYSDAWGPLPFALGSTPETYEVQRTIVGLEP